jgi:putative transposase
MVAAAAVHALYASPVHRCDAILRVLSSYVDYYHRTRTHLSLDKDCPDPRPIVLRRIGQVIAIPQVSGLHHRYERFAA